MPSGPLQKWRPSSGVMTLPKKAVLRVPVVPVKDTIRQVGEQGSAP